MLVRSQRLFGRIATKSKSRTEYCVHEIGGRRSTIKLEDVYGNDFQGCTIFNWFDSGTRRRSDMVIESTIAVLTMERKSKLIQNYLAKKLNSYLAHN